MKLTPELLAQSESSLNTLQDRELDLRGLKIPVIENVGVTRDQHDMIDLTDNDIRYLGNFPRMRRLRHLVLSNNVVARIDPRLYQLLPFLESLVLTNNAIAEFSQVSHLRRLHKLELLSLMSNPVSRQKHYREFVIWRIPSLRVLDYKRITQRVRHPQRVHTHCRNAHMHRASSKPTMLGRRHLPRRCWGARTRTRHRADRSSPAHSQAPRAACCPQKNARRLSKPSK